MLQAIPLFSHSAFKRLVLQMYKNTGLFGKWLTPYQMETFRLVQIESILQTKKKKNSHNVFKSTVSEL